MPLRKQDDLPKIPKTRTKSIEQLKQITPSAKEDSIEYRISAYYKYDERKNKQYYVFGISTMKEFTALNYTISIDVRKKGDIIDVSLLGLNTLQAYLVKPQPAFSEIKFEELFGEHTINIIKQDGTINSAVYEFNVYNKTIKLLDTFVPEKKNNRKFCTFDVAEDSFTFSEE